MSNLVNVEVKPTVALPVASVAATEKEGPCPKGIPYPLLHATVFYIAHKGISLGYHFNWHFCLKEELAMVEPEKPNEQSSRQTMWYPHSIELGEDIFDLRSGGILSVRRGSGMFVLPGPVVKQYWKTFVKRFETEARIPFGMFSGRIQGALTDPKRLLSDCYKFYISDL